MAKGVCFRIKLKQKTKRKFVLERLEYAYNYGNYRDLYNASPAGGGAATRSESLTEFEWVPKYTNPLNPAKEVPPFIRFKLKFLKLGAVKNLVYKATIRLCRFDESGGDKNSCDPVKAKDAEDGEIDD